MKTIPKSLAIVGIVLAIALLVLLVWATINQRRNLAFFSFVILALAYVFLKFVRK